MSVPPVSAISVSCLPASWAAVLTTLVLPTPEGPTRMHIQPLLMACSTDSRTACSLGSSCSVWPGCVLGTRHDGLAAGLPANAPETYFRALCVLEMHMQPLLMVCSTDSSTACALGSSCRLHFYGGLSYAQLMARIECPCSRCLWLAALNPALLLHDAAAVVYGLAVCWEQGMMALLMFCLQRHQNTIQRTLCSGTGACLS